jgi:hypothetical protein
LHHDSAFAALQQKISTVPGHSQQTGQVHTSSSQLTPGTNAQALSSSNTSNITHIHWLLALSPRLRSVLPRVCGPQAVNAALMRASSGNRVSNLPSAGSSRRTAATGSGALAPSTPTLPAPHPGVTGTGSKHGSYSLTAQHSLSALAEVAPAPPVAVPQELRVCWATLMCAVGFCDRCSKTARARLGAAGAAVGRDGDPQGMNQVKAVAATGVGATSGGQQQTRSEGGPEDASTKYWFTLLEVG